MKEHIRYGFHHAGTYTPDNAGKFRNHWHRFIAESPLHTLIKRSQHVAFNLEDLSEAIVGEEVIPGPYEPTGGLL